MSTATTTPPKKDKGVLFIFFTLLIDVIGFGIIIPVLPKLISTLKNVPLNEAAKYGGFLLTTFAIMQFFCSPILGSLSDKYGRRPILLFSLLGFGLDYLIMAFAPTYGWLFLGRMIAGVTGASFTTASAYIADISHDGNRHKNFGMIGVAFGVGFIVGPAIGGLLGKLDPHYPFFAAAAMSLINFLYGYFILPESLPIEKRRDLDWKKLNPISTLLKLRKYKNIGWLMFAFFLLGFGSHAVQSNWAYFTMYKFRWSEATVGMSLALVGLLVAIVQGGLISWVVRKIGNEKSIYIGFLFYSIGMFLFSFASQSWMMFAFLIPYCLGGISGPALQSTMTKSVPQNEQGELQGGLTSLQSLTTIFGPYVMTNIFYYFTTDKAPFKFSGIPFFLGGLCMLTSAIVSYIILRNKKQKDVAIA